MIKNNTKIDVEAKSIDLVELRGMLQHGDMRKLADRLDFSYPYISDVLNPKMPKKYNADIIKAAVELVQGRSKIKIDASLAEILVKNGGNGVPKSAKD